MASHSYMYCLLQALGIHTCTLGSGRGGGVHSAHHHTSFSCVASINLTVKAELKVYCDVSMIQLLCYGYENQGATHALPCMKAWLAIG